MSTCNNQLKAEGAQTWPRTCARCGIHKCNHPDFSEKPTGTPTLKAIAGMIQKLSYRDMQTLAVQLDKNLAAEEYTTPELADAILNTAEDILKS